MTSIIKTVASTRENQEIVYVGGPYYDDLQSKKTLFPFTFKKGVLEIANINGFNLTGVGLLDGKAVKPLNVGTANGGLAKRHGGLNLVQDIGPNFKTYIYNCRWAEDASGDVVSISSIKVKTPGIITRVQQLNNSTNDVTTNLPQYINPTGGSYVVSDKVPVDGYAFENSTYGTTYAFIEPLVVQIETVGYGVQYVTFFTSWDH